MEHLFKRFGDIERFQNYSISEEDGVHTIKLLAPGFKKDDINVQANNEYISIKGDISDDGALSNINISKKLDYIFSLKNLDNDNIELILEDGILTIKLKQKLPKEKKLKKINFN